MCRVPVVAVPAEGACTVAREPECATSGQVVLNVFPLENLRLPLLAGWVTADFADGAHVEAEF
ncbi:MAG TPA: hypothetical protein VJR89_24645 [Polyangiales bacterium]|nr:hypothetical protein [Polyangiales bacterium]